MLRADTGDTREPQNEGILAPITNVAATVAGAAAVARLSITPSGISLALCADVQATVVASLKARRPPRRNPQHRMQVFRY